jgi:hypothetical protein
MARRKLISWTWSLACLVMVFHSEVTRNSLWTSQYLAFQNLNVDSEEMRRLSGHCCSPCHDTTLCVSPAYKASHPLHQKWSCWLFYGTQSSCKSLFDKLGSSQRAVYKYHTVGLDGIDELLRYCTYCLSTQVSVKVICYA